MQHSVVSLKTSSLPMTKPSKIQTPRFDEPLCSKCGLCMGNVWPVKESLESCVFRCGWVENHEQRIFGRVRNPEDSDELRFGISLKRFNATLKKPVNGAQWSGIITRISTMALQTNLVDAVLTLHGEPLKPKAVLAKTAQDIHEARGNKPVLSPVLQALHTAYREKTTRLLIVGAACHVHMVRDFTRKKPYFANLELYIVGIPCTDNLEPSHLQWVFRNISKKPETVINFEFMQDYRVHILHKAGKVEKIPFFCLPSAVMKVGVFPNSCLSCFDYINSLSDITVGYLGAPYSKNRKTQWIIVRTERGKKLLDLINDEIETSPEVFFGDSHSAVQAALQPTLMPILQPEKLDDRKAMPKWLGIYLSYKKAKSGPGGTEFAKYSIDIHAIRNFYFLKMYRPDDIGIVPTHIYDLLSQYDLSSIERIIES
ncbi:MAG: Coenzyme F420 hydrogenase/dehydrogenase, beta subunit C-terminal domain [Chlorobium sp.]|nr:Coenzyme F420 hydrogenase/dehydrogenase, beta subunit C-terminal domain [Chlorobium sp.]MCF8272140.1 Coenzyme F420 hydrogenase/dehydrogenase, beta subunit C-terminal domain [Chlorobium sp.]MCF8288247.1 Coenzyme F420 hydrogenase/dehydrogenase, beta subunit C-terminal domain [Chlorobium sp.]MCF8385946.1 Coenzyme F420 hydrogenase/dehydrogenase, beta subunit C-terminal domain [Chlorobium sp.]